MGQSAKRCRLSSPRHKKVFGAWMSVKRSVLGLNGEGMVDIIDVKIASWFLFPLFIDFVTGTNSLSNIVGWVLCPFAICFLLSTVFSALTLIFRQAGHWTFKFFPIFVLSFDIVIIVLAFI